MAGLRGEWMDDVVEGELDGKAVEDEALPRRNSPRWSVRNRPEAARDFSTLAFAGGNAQAWD